MGGRSISRDATGVQSAARTLRILGEIGSSTSGISAATIAERLGLSPSTTYRLLQMLQQHDFVWRGTDHRYVLGRAVDTLGRAVHGQLEAVAPVRNVLDAVRDAAHGAAYLTVFQGDDIAVAHIAESHALPRIRQLHVGFADSAHTTAFGKLMLSTKNEVELTRYLERHGAPALTTYSVTGMLSLRAQLDRVRAYQLAVEVEEYMPKLACIAAPVRSSSGRVLGAVSVSVQAKDFARRRHDLERVVRRGAWHVSSLVN